MADLVRRAPRAAPMKRSRQQDRGPRTSYTLPLEARFLIEQEWAVDAADIERIVARVARIPAKQASSSDRERLRTLEESLGLFEEGIKLSRAAQTRLDAAQHKVEKLLGVDEKGKPRKVPFGDDDDGG